MNLSGGREFQSRLAVPRTEECPLADHLHHYPLTRHTLHLCVDMQRLFSAEGPANSSRYARRMKRPAGLLMAGGSRPLGTRHFAWPNIKSLSMIYVMYLLRTPANLRTRVMSG
jgi:hypothetical protein